METCTHDMAMNSMQIRGSQTFTSSISATRTPPMSPLLHRSFALFLNSLVLSHHGHIFWLSHSASCVAQSKHSLQSYAPSLRSTPDPTPETSDPTISTATSEAPIIPLNSRCNDSRFSCAHILVSYVVYKVRPKSAVPPASLSTFFSPTRRVCDMHL